MLPLYALSSTPVRGEYIGAKKLASSSNIDYEDGGIALSDPSMGLKYQVWCGRIVGNDVVLSAPSVADTVIYSASDLSELSLTFDQNMNPAIAYMQGGEAKLRWYNTTIPGYEILSFGSTSVSPKVFMDDKRFLQAGANDILLVYVRDNKMRYRVQRERFLIEYTLMDGVKKVLKVGMSNKLRIQFEIELVN